MALAEAAVQGIELESWNKMIASTIYSGKTLYNRIKKGTKTYETANVTARPGNIGATTGLAQRSAFQVPMRIQSGATIVQGTGDGDSLGRGTGSQWITGDIAPVFLFSGCEITYLAQMATAGPKRGLISVRAQELKNSLDSYLRGIEALFNGDGSGALDQIPTGATIVSGTATAPNISSITMSNANQFQDQQTVQVFSAVGGTLRGSFVISYADGVANTIFSTTALPPGTAAGDFLMVAGASGAANSSIAGIKTYQLFSNTGTVLGIPRASYPGRLSTPNINLNNNPVNPAVPYQAEILVERGLGEDAPELEGAIWYGGPGQQLAITQLYQNVLSQNQIQQGGDSAMDVVKKNMTPTFGGREYVKGYNATLNRIDLLCLKSWGIAEMIEPSLYDFGNGVTCMPVPDPSGHGWLTSNIFYYNSAMNLFQSNMKAGCYITQATEPVI